MANARYVTSEVLYDGKEVGLSGRVMSLDYTDNSSGVSDEIVLTFSGRDAYWLRDGFAPEKGHDLDVSFWLRHWKRQGDCLRYHCGNFTLDDITYSGAPHQCTIRGVSIPANESFQTCPVSKTWKQITLKQIAEEMKGKYGMSDLFYWGGEPVIDTVEQDNQADSTFLYNLCEEQGMFLKIYKKALVVFDKAVYEPRGITARFTETDFETWKWNSTLNGTYTGAEISYTVPKKKETVTAMVGQGPRILRLNDKAENEGEALRLAKARVNAANEKAVTVSFAALGNPDVVATCNVELYGLGRCSGKYFVDKVKHKVTGNGGYSMDVSGYRIFERL